MGQYSRHQINDMMRDEALDRRDEALDRAEERIAYLNSFINYITRSRYYKFRCSRKQLEQQFKHYEREQREKQEREKKQSAEAFDEQQRRFPPRPSTVEEQVSKSDSGAFAIDLSEVED